jgi:hypothetical protein
MILRHTSKLHCAQFLSLCVSFFCVSHSLIAESKDTNKTFDKNVLPSLQNHCIRCHGPQKVEGEFRIDTLSKNVGEKDTPAWAELMERISSGEMPPEDVKNPPTAVGRKVGECRQVVDLHGLDALCCVLLNTSEVIYVP